jgi:hypothetical protein
LSGKAIKDATAAVFDAGAELLRVGAAGAVAAAFLSQRG